MLNSINILYISLTGNTKDFIRQLEDYYKEKKSRFTLKMSKKS